MYWVDAFTKELVKEKEVNAPPERYYEYRKGTLEGVIIETYVKSEEPLELLEFSHPTSDTQTVILTSVQRREHLKSHGLSENARLYRYTVPPKWYDEEVARYENQEKHNESV